MRHTNAQLLEGGKMKAIIKVKKIYGNLRYFPDNDLAISFHNLIKWKDKEVKCFKYIEIVELKKLGELLNFEIELINCF